MIAIIAILAAMLLPALGQARHKAREIACLNQTRQLGLAVIMYAQDNGGFFPYRWAQGPAHWNAGSQYDYHLTIQDYIAPSPVYNCPFVDLDYTDQWPDGTQYRCTAITYLQAIGIAQPIFSPTGLLLQART